MTRKRRPHTGPGLSFDEALGLTLNQYMLVGGITRARLGEILGVAGSNISQRIRGRATWSAEDLVAVANIFGVTTDTLVPSKTTDGWVPSPVRAGHAEGPSPGGTSQPSQQHPPDHRPPPTATPLTWDCPPPPEAPAEPRHQHA